MANMKVILATKIEGLGCEADLVTVKAGYGRNYLIPQGLAFEATPANQRFINMLQKKRAEREAAELANFREIYMGDIAAPGILYRSASPINNEHNRAHYANAFAEAAGVNGVLNLADTNEDVESYIAADDFDSEYYASLYEEGKVLALGMSVDFLSDDFGNKLAAGIEKLSELDPPYLIHCTEGKDRAGFTSALFECLLGGSYDEIVDDFMLSMANYYGVTEETDARKYQFIFENNIAAMLPVITGGEDPTTADLSAAARSYLIDHGMSEEGVDRLVGKLTGSIHVN